MKGFLTLIKLNFKGFLYQVERVILKSLIITTAKIFLTYVLKVIVKHHYIF